MRNPDLRVSNAQTFTITAAPALVVSFSSPDEGATVIGTATITMSETGAPSAPTGTMEEYWLQHPIATTSDAADGAAAAASAMLPFTAFQSASASCSATSPLRRVAIV